MGSLLWDVRQQRPALNLKQGVFYNGIEGYSIKVNKKNNDDNTLEEIMIYDHTSRYGNNKIILAKRGTMKIVENNTYLQLTLEDGYSYEELEPYPINKRVGAPMRRLKFSKNTIRFGLTEFNLTRTDEELFKDHEQMLNLSQLVSAEDTLKKWMNIRNVRIQKSINSRYFFGQHPDKIGQEIPPEIMEISNDFEASNAINTSTIPIVVPKKPIIGATPEQVARTPSFSPNRDSSKSP